MSQQSRTRSLSRIRLLQVPKTWSAASRLTHTLAGVMGLLPGAGSPRGQADLQAAAGPGGEAARRWGCLSCQMHSPGSTGATRSRLTQGPSAQLGQTGRVWWPSPRLACPRLPTPHPHVPCGAGILQVPQSPHERAALDL